MSDLPVDPFEHGIDQPLIDRISPPVGLMTISWGFIDQYMSAIVEASAKPVADAGIRVERPLKFADKCKYLRKIFRRVNALSAYKARADKLLEDVKPLERLRHLLTHGTVVQYKPDVDTVTIIRVNPARDGDPYHVFQTEEVAVPIIVSVGAAAQNVASRWGEIAIEMVRELLPDHP